MNLFNSARIRLTAWYLVLIAIISLSFSAALYSYVSWELERGFLMAEYQLRGQPIPKKRVKMLLEEELAEAKKEVIVRLLTINGVILIFSGGVGYFLAGKTLNPIKEMIEEQKRFIADASHELRTPLTSMKTEIEVALRDKNLNKKEAEQLLHSNLQEVDKMRSLTNYLLSLSRYESNRQDIPMEKIDLAKVVSDAIQKNLPQANEKKININEKLEKVFIRGNEDSLSELFSILIDNAIKYSPKNKKVIITVKKSKRKAMIKIQDFGLGIAESELIHIFDRFYRADSSRTKQKIEGYGLGLSIAKSIIDFHKGEVEVMSKLNKGTTFKIRFPNASKK